MDNETEVIRRQMEETRAALQDKLETLEQQVKDTVQSATEAVTTVKESVQDTVETVKETFDLRLQVQRHPWMMVCGAAAVGFLGGRLLEGIRAVSPSAPGNPAPPNSDRFAAPPIPRLNLEEAEAPRRPKAHAWWDAVTKEYSDEVNKVKGLALSTLGGLIGEMLTEAAPPALKEQIKEVVDGVTAKLGGHPLKEPLFPPTTAKSPGTGNGVHREEKSATLGGMRRDWDEGMDRFDR